MVVGVDTAQSVYISVPVIIVTSYDMIGRIVVHTD